MPFTLKLRRLFSRQRLKDALDDEGVFGPAETYSSSDSESITVSGSPHSPQPIPATLVPEGYFDTDLGIPHGPAANPIDIGIAIPEEDVEYDWHGGRRRITIASLNHDPYFPSSPSYPKPLHPSHLVQIPSRPLKTLPHLPGNVLRQIFAAYACIGDSRPNPRYGPLLLGQICQRWRSVAHSTPQLWSALTIIAGAHVCVPRMPLLKAWLNRSGTCPLELTVVYDHTLEDTPGNFGSITIVSDLILTHSSRWRSVCLNYTRTRQLIDMLARIPSWGLPILHSIEISLRQRVAHPEQHAILSSFLSSAPCLQQLTCRGVSDIPKVSIPPQLTHLDLEAALSPRDCLNLLAGGRQLRDCRFHMEHSDESGSLDDFPLLAHPLHSLYISSQESLGDFFDRLILPNLESLGVSARWTSDRSLPKWPQRQFVSLLSRSSPAITTFAVRCLPMSDVELLECLLYISDTLRSLEVYVVGGEGTISITDVGIKALTFHNYRHNLCPKLECLTLSGCVFATDGLVADMVASRRRKFPSQDTDTRQLKHVEIAFPTANHSQDVRYLKSLLKGGLKGEVIQGERSRTY